MGGTEGRKPPPSHLPQAERLRVISPSHRLFQRQIFKAPILWLRALRSYFIYSFTYCTNICWTLCQAVLRLSGKCKCGKNIDTVINNTIDYEGNKSSNRELSPGWDLKCGAAPRVSVSIICVQMSSTLFYSFSIYQVLKTVEMNRKSLRELLERCWISLKVDFKKGEWFRIEIT